MEIEFKIVLPDEGSSAALLRALERRGAAQGATRRQVNHYFDTNDRALRSAKLALRLREENASFAITAKGGSRRSAGGVLTSRPEVESKVSTEVAKGVLAGHTSALRALQDALVDIDGEAAFLLQRVQETLGGRHLEYLGCFENERTRPGAVTITATGMQLELLFEIDCTRFPGDRIEREVELEIDDPDQAPAVEAWLHELFAEIGVPWVTAPSKAQRFFDALHTRSDPR